MSYQGPKGLTHPTPFLTNEQVMMHCGYVECLMLEFVMSVICYLMPDNHHSAVIERVRCLCLQKMHGPVPLLLMVNVC